MKRDLCVSLSTANKVALLSLVVAGLSNLALASPGSCLHGADTCPDSSSMLQSKVKVTDSIAAQSAEVSEKGRSSLENKVDADINSAGSNAQGKVKLSSDAEPSPVVRRDSPPPHAPVVRHPPPPPSIVRRDAYCSNRGGAGGSTKYSKNVGASNAAACASHVASTDGCGKWFSYGNNDGWCDCVKKVDGACAYSAFGGYDVYKLGKATDAETPPPPPIIRRNSYCRNRGGFGGRNKYSKNVGANNAAACASHAASTDGCGKWFSYGHHDGWCDCVKKGDGPCTYAAYGGYDVYKFRGELPPSPTQPPKAPATSVVHGDSYCNNRGGVGGSNEYSKNVGANDAAACASYVASIDGCGEWFSYGNNDGWCDCVKKEDGDCTHSAFGGYDVYKITN